MKKFLQGFVYAWQGVKYAFSTQINFKVHFLCTFIAVAAGFSYNLNMNEWLWLLASVAFVFVSELFNTAVEVLTDLVSPGYHPMAGLVKDLASGAVLVAALFAFITGLFIFVPKII